MLVLLERLARSVPHKPASTGSRAVVGFDPHALTAMIGASAPASPASVRANPTLRGARTHRRSASLLPSASSSSFVARRRRPAVRRRGVAVIVHSAASATHALGVDVGTQGTKAILYDLSSKAVAGKGSCSYGLMPTPAGRPNAAEQDPSTWLEGVRVAVKAALEEAGLEPSAIAAVGVSGQQHGMVALDAECEVIRPAKLWCDVESAKEAKELGDRFGWAMQAGFTSSKVLWMKRHEPHNWARTEHVLLPHDWINYKLTGEIATDPGDASGIGVLDLTTRSFRDDLCEFVDPKFRRLLPDIVDPEERGVLGTVTAEASNSWLEGLIPAGAIVSVGSGDNMMSALGAGCVDEGDLVVSLGTSGTVFGYSSTPVIDATGAVAPFCDATGGYLPLLCTMNCTKVVEEPLLWYGCDHGQMVKLARSVPPGCDGVRFLPYITGERTPNWPDATGAIVGIRPGSLVNPAVAYRAAMEGATYSLLAGVRRMSELGMPAPREVKVVGGGSKSPLWRQIIADAFDVKVRRLREAESAALGAATQAAAAAEGVDAKSYVRANLATSQEGGSEEEEEIHSPVPEAVEALRAGYELFIAEGRALFGAGGGE